MSSDGPIVDEVRRRRLEISEEYGHDLGKYTRYLRQIQDKYAERVVSQLTVVPPKPPKAGRNDSEG